MTWKGLICRKTNKQPSHPILSFFLSLLFSRQLHLLIFLSFSDSFFLCLLLRSLSKDENRYVSD